MCLRVGLRYQRLAELQREYLEEVDAILGGLSTPQERIASVEEMRRQVGALLGSLGDRKKIIQEHINDPATYDPPAGDS